MSERAYAVQALTGRLMVQQLGRLGIPKRLQLPFDSLVVSMFTGVGQPIGQVPHALVTFSTHVLVFYRR